MSPGDMTEVERSFFDKMRRLRESINEGEMVARDMFNSDIWDAEDPGCEGSLLQRQGHHL